MVEKPQFQITDKAMVVGAVYINETQYFNNVPEVAWYFYIGGYQFAQKWLKDRKGRKLKFEDILHYQKNTLYNICLSLGQFSQAHPSVCHGLI